jgi:hypothetical protein
MVYCLVIGRLYALLKGEGEEMITRNQLTIEETATSSDERTGLSFVYGAGLASAVFLGSESFGTRDHILLSQILDIPFRRLLRLAGSRWRYSIPPPHGLLYVSEVKVTLRLTVNQSVCLGVEPHLRLMTRYLLLFDSYSLVMVGPHL